jgi:hypothetical protein
MFNPFTLRGTLQNPAEFIGRSGEINDILTRLRAMQSCSVVGERRIGKSPCSITWLKPALHASAMGTIVFCTSN